MNILFGPTLNFDRVRVPAHRSFARLLPVLPHGYQAWECLQTWVCRQCGVRPLVCSSRRSTSWTRRCTCTTCRLTTRTTTSVNSTLARTSTTTPRHRPRSQADSSQTPDADMPVVTVNEVNGAVEERQERSRKSSPSRSPVLYRMPEEQAESLSTTPYPRHPCASCQPCTRPRRRIPSAELPPFFCPKHKCLC